jgi:hypothetical protein
MGVGLSAESNTTGGGLVAFDLAWLICSHNRLLFQKVLTLGLCIAILPSITTCIEQIRALNQQGFIVKGGVMAEKEYTWDDTIAVIGQDFSGGIERTGADPAERSTIRRFCEPLELDCPLHYDDEVAKQHGYEGVVAPVSMINQTLTTPALWEPGDPTRWADADRNTLSPRPGSDVEVPEAPMPKTSAAFATDIEIEYFAPVYVGDRLTSKGRKLLSVVERTTRVGHGAFMVWENEIYNQRGELVAKCRNGGYSYNPNPTQ